MGSVVGWGRGAVDGCMGAGERDEVAMLDNGTGFSALNEDDVRVGDEARWNKLVVNGDFSLHCGDKGVTVLVQTARGDDGREKGLVVAAEDLLGVDGAAIVLVTFCGLPTYFFPYFSKPSPCTTTPGLSHSPFLVASIPFYLFTASLTHYDSL